MKDTQSTGDAFKQRLDALGATHVHVSMVDAEAEFRNKLISAEKAIGLAKKGYAFCEILYFWDIAEEPFIYNTFADRPAALDASSIRAYPFSENTAFCLADFSGEFGNLSPRNQCLKQIARAGELGFDVFSAFEVEFIVFDETAESMRAKNYENLTHLAEGNRTYSIPTMAEHQELMLGLVDMLKVMEVEPDALHTELGPGFFELPIAYSAGIKAADDAAIFKNFARAYFARHKKTVGFMSRYSDDLPGQSAHLHISLRDKQGTPVFFDAEGEQGLSKTARHFIGGVLKYLPEMLVLSAHTVNAYKRLVPSSWAPVSASWGAQNRTAAVRVIGDTPDSTRLEFRVPSADTNPYTALTFLIAAGLEGIEKEISAPPISDESAYHAEPDPAHRFPQNLGEAIDRMKTSDAARRLFGDDFVDTFLNIRRHEWQCYQAYLNQISPWEKQRFLGVV